MKGAPSVRAPLKAAAQTTRLVSGTSNSRSSVASVSAANVWPQAKASPAQPRKALAAPLSKLPLSSVLRSLLVLSVSSSSLLLKPCIYTLSLLAHPRNAFWDVSKNPLLNMLVKHTIYKQFNAGENKVEVQNSINQIKQLGCRGVLLGYAREVLVGENSDAPYDEKAALAEIQMWMDGTLQTVDMAQPGDFVALKYV
jgi:hypothetical protein